MPWRSALLRGTRVLARCDESGAWLSEGGRVEIRYKPQDGRAYRAAAGNLKGTDDPVLPDEHCAPAEASAVKPASASGRAKSSRSAGAKQVEAGPLPDNAIIAYTDGACSGNPGPAGLGVVVLDGTARRELSEYLGHGTNNVAELTAILRALEGTAETDRPMVIHTDSQYSIGVLTKGWKPKVNQELIAAIKQAMRVFPDLRFVYVRGHAGIPLNERADALAREAVEMRESQPWLEIASP